MDQPEITLETLSNRTGVEPRTLRSWIKEGLLIPPVRTGRGAIYPAINAERALAVSALKETQGMSFAEIRRCFLMATDEQIRVWAAEAGPLVAPPGSARDYVRMLSQSVQGSSKSSRSLHEARSFLEQPTMSSRRDYWHPDDKSPFGDASTLGRIEALIMALERLLADPAPRRSQSAIWTRIGITADLELSVRGDLSPSERKLFEQLADQLRAILTGRTRL